MPTCAGPHVKSKSTFVYVGNAKWSSKVKTSCGERPKDSPVVSTCTKGKLKDINGDDKCAVERDSAFQQSNHNNKNVCSNQTISDKSCRVGKKPILLTERNIESLNRKKVESTILRRKIPSKQFVNAAAVKNNTKSVTSSSRKIIRDELRDKRGVRLVTSEVRINESGVVRNSYSLKDNSTECRKTKRIDQNYARLGKSQNNCNVTTQSAHCLRSSSSDSERKAISERKTVQKPARSCSDVDVVATRKDILETSSRDETGEPISDKVCVFNHVHNYFSTSRGNQIPVGSLSPNHGLITERRKSTSPITTYTCSRRYLCDQHTLNAAICRHSEDDISQNVCCWNRRHYSQWNCVNEDATKEKCDADLSCKVCKGNCKHISGSEKISNDLSGNRSVCTAAESNFADKRKICSSLAHRNDSSYNIGLHKEQEVDCFLDYTSAHSSCTRFIDHAQIKSTIKHASSAGYCLCTEKGCVLSSSSSEHDTPDFKDKNICHVCRQTFAQKGQICQSYPQVCEGNGSSNSSTNSEILSTGISSKTGADNVNTSLCRDNSIKGQSADETDRDDCLRHSNELNGTFSEEFNELCSVLDPYLTPCLPDDGVIDRSTHCQCLLNTSHTKLTGSKREANTVQQGNKSGFNLGINVSLKDRNLQGSEIDGKESADYFLRTAGNGFKCCKEDSQEQESCLANKNITFGEDHNVSNWKACSSGRDSLIFSGISSTGSSKIDYQLIDLTAFQPPVSSEGCIGTERLISAGKEQKQKLARGRTDESDQSVHNEEASEVRCNNHNNYLARLETLDVNGEVLSKDESQPFKKVVEHGNKVFDEKCGGKNHRPRATDFLSNFNSDNDIKCVSGKKDLIYVFSENVSNIGDISEGKIAKNSNSLIVCGNSVLSDPDRSVCSVCGRSGNRKIKKNDKERKLQSNERKRQVNDRHAKRTSKNIRTAPQIRSGGESASQDEKYHHIVIDETQAKPTDKTITESKGLFHCGNSKANRFRSSAKLSKNAAQHKSSAKSIDANICTTNSTKLQTINSSIKEIRNQNGKGSGVERMNSNNQKRKEKNITTDLLATKRVSEPNIIQSLDENIQLKQHKSTVAQEKTFPERRKLDNCCVPGVHSISNKSAPCRTVLLKSANVDGVAHGVKSSKFSVSKSKKEMENKSMSVRSERREKGEKSVIPSMSKLTQKSTSKDSPKTSNDVTASELRRSRSTTPASVGSVVSTSRDSKMLTSQSMQKLAKRLEETKELKKPLSEQNKVESVSSVQSKEMKELKKPISEQKNVRSANSVQTRTNSIHSKAKLKDAQCRREVDGVSKMNVTKRKGSKPSSAPMLSVKNVSSSRDIRSRSGTPSSTSSTTSPICQRRAETKSVSGNRRKSDASIMSPRCERKTDLNTLNSKHNASERAIFGISGAKTKMSKLPTRTLSSKLGTTKAERVQEKAQICSDESVSIDPTRRTRQVVTKTTTKVEENCAHMKSSQNSVTNVKTTRGSGLNSVSHRSDLTVTQPHPGSEETFACLQNTFDGSVSEMDGQSPTSAEKESNLSTSIYEKLSTSCSSEDSKVEKNVVERKGKTKSPVNTISGQPTKNVIKVNRPGKLMGGKTKTGPTLPGQIKPKINTSSLSEKTRKTTLAVVPVPTPTRETKSHSSSRNSSRQTSPTDSDKCVELKNNKQILSGVQGSSHVLESKRTYVSGRTKTRTTRSVGKIEMSKKSESTKKAKIQKASSMSDFERNLKSTEENNGTEEKAASADNKTVLVKHDSKMKTLRVSNCAANLEIEAKIHCKVPNKILSESEISCKSGSERSNLRESEGKTDVRDWTTEFPKNCEINDFKKKDNWCAPTLHLDLQESATEVPLRDTEYHGAPNSEVQMTENLKYGEASSRASMCSDVTDNHQQNVFLDIEVLKQREISSQIRDAAFAEGRDTNYREIAAQRMHGSQMHELLDLGDNLDGRLISELGGKLKTENKIEAVRFQEGNCQTKAGLEEGAGTAKLGDNTYDKKVVVSESQKDFTTTTKEINQLTSDLETMYDNQINCSNGERTDYHFDSDDKVLGNTAYEQRTVLDSCAISVSRQEPIANFDEKRDDKKTKLHAQEYCLLDSRERKHTEIDKKLGNEFICSEQTFGDNSCLCAENDETTSFNDTSIQNETLCVRNSMQILQSENYWQREDLYSDINGKDTHLCDQGAEEEVDQNFIKSQVLDVINTKPEMDFALTNPTLYGSRADQPRDTDLTQDVHGYGINPTWCHDPFGRSDQVSADNWQYLSTDDKAPLADAIIKGAVVTVLESGSSPKEIKNSLKQISGSNINNAEISEHSKEPFKKEEFNEICENADASSHKYVSMGCSADMQPHLHLNEMLFDGDKTRSRDEIKTNEHKEGIFGPQVSYLQKNTSPEGVSDSSQFHMSVLSHENIISQKSSCNQEKSDSANEPNLLPTNRKQPVYKKHLTTDLHSTTFQEQNICGSRDILGTSAQIDSIREGICKKQILKSAIQNGSDNKSPRDLVTEYDTESISNSNTDISEEISEKGQQSYQNINSLVTDNLEFTESADVGYSHDIGGIPTSADDNVFNGIYNADARQTLNDFIGSDVESDGNSEDHSFGTDLHSDKIFVNPSLSEDKSITLRALCTISLQNCKEFKNEIQTEAGEEPCYFVNEFGSSFEETCESFVDAEESLEGSDEENISKFPDLFKHEGLYATEEAENSFESFHDAVETLENLNEDNIRGAENAESGDEFRQCCLANLDVGNKTVEGTNNESIVKQETGDAVCDGVYRDVRQAISQDSSRSAEFDGTSVVHEGTGSTNNTDNMDNTRVRTTLQFVRRISDSSSTSKTSLSTKFKQVKSGSENTAVSVDRDYHNSASTRDFGISGGANTYVLRSIDTGYSESECGNQIGSESSWPSSRLQERSVSEIHGSKLAGSTGVAGDVGLTTSQTASQTSNNVLYNIQKLQSRQNVTKHVETINVLKSTRGTVERKVSTHGTNSCLSVGIDKGNEKLITSNYQLGRSNENSISETVLPTPGFSGKNVSERLNVDSSGEMDHQTRTCDFDVRTYVRTVDGKDVNVTRENETVPQRRVRRRFITRAKTSDVTDSSHSLKDLSTKPISQKSTLFGTESLVQSRKNMFDTASTQSATVLTDTCEKSDSEYEHTSACLTSRPNYTIKYAKVNAPENLFEAESDEKCNDVHTGDIRSVEKTYEQFEKTKNLESTRDNETNLHSSESCVSTENQSFEITLNLNIPQRLEQESIHSENGVSECDAARKKQETFEENYTLDLDSSTNIPPHDLQTTLQEKSEFRFTLDVNVQEDKISSDLETDKISSDQRGGRNYKNVDQCSNKSIEGIRSTLNATENIENLTNIPINSAVHSEDQVFKESSSDSSTKSADSGVESMEIHSMDSSSIATDISTIALEISSTFGNNIDRDGKTESIDISTSQENLTSVSSLCHNNSSSRSCDVSRETKSKTSEASLIPLNQLPEKTLTKDYSTSDVLDVNKCTDSARVQICEPIYSDELTSAGNKTVNEINKEITPESTCKTPIATCTDNYGDAKKQMEVNIAEKLNELSAAPCAGDLENIGSSEVVLDIGKSEHVVSKTKHLSSNLKSNGSQNSESWNKDVCDSSTESARTCQNQTLMTSENADNGDGSHGDIEKINRRQERLNRKNVRRATAEICVRKAAFENTDTSDVNDQSGDILNNSGSTAPKQRSGIRKSSSFRIEREQNDEESAENCANQSIESQITNYRKVSDICKQFLNKASVRTKSRLSESPSSSEVHSPLTGRKLQWVKSDGKWANIPVPISNNDKTKDENSEVEKPKEASRSFKDIVNRWKNRDQLTKVKQGTNPDLTIKQTTTEPSQDKKMTKFDRVSTDDNIKKGKSTQNTEVKGDIQSLEVSSRNADEKDTCCDKNTGNLEMSKGNEPSNMSDSCYVGQSLKAQDQSKIEARYSEKCFELFSTTADSDGTVDSAVGEKLERAEGTKTSIMPDSCLEGKQTSCHGDFGIDINQASVDSTFVLSQAIGINASEVFQENEQTDISCLETTDTEKEKIPQLNVQNTPKSSKSSLESDLESDDLERMDKPELDNNLSLKDNHVIQNINKETSLESSCEEKKHAGIQNGAKVQKGTTGETVLGVNDGKTQHLNSLRMFEDISIETNQIATSQDSVPSLDEETDTFDQNATELQENALSTEDTLPANDQEFIEEVQKSESTVSDTSPKSLIEVTSTFPDNEGSFIDQCQGHGFQYADESSDEHEVTEYDAPSKLNARQQNDLVNNDLTVLKSSTVDSLGLKEAKKTETVTAKLSEETDISIALDDRGYDKIAEPSAEIGHEEEYIGAHEVKSSLNLTENSSNEQDEALRVEFCCVDVCPPERPEFNDSISKPGNRVLSEMKHIEKEEEIRTESYTNINIKSCDKTYVDGLSGREVLVCETEVKNSISDEMTSEPGLRENGDQLQPGPIVDKTITESQLQHMEDNACLVNEQKEPSINTTVEPSVRETNKKEITFCTEEGEIPEVCHILVTDDKNDKEELLETETITTEIPTHDEAKFNNINEDSEEEEDTSTLNTIGVKDSIESLKTICTLDSEKSENDISNERKESKCEAESVIQLEVATVLKEKSTERTSELSITDVSISEGKEGRNVPLSKNKTCSSGESDVNIIDAVVSNIDVNVTLESDQVCERRMSETPESPYKELKGHVISVKALPHTNERKQESSNNLEISESGLKIDSEKDKLELQSSDILSNESTDSVSNENNLQMSSKLIETERHGCKVGAQTLSAHIITSNEDQRIEKLSFEQIDAEVIAKLSEPTNKLEMAKRTNELGNKTSKEISRISPVVALPTTKNAKEISANEQPLEVEIIGQGINVNIDDTCIKVVQDSNKSDVNNVQISGKREVPDNRKVKITGLEPQKPDQPQVAPKSWRQIPSKVDTSSSLIYNKTAISGERQTRLWETARKGVFKMNRQISSESSKLFLEKAGYIKPGTYKSAKPEIGIKQKPTVEQKPQPKRSEENVEPVTVADNRVSDKSENKSEDMPQRIPKLKAVKIQQEEIFEGKPEYTKECNIFSLFTAAQKCTSPVEPNQKPILCSNDKQEASLQSQKDDEHIGITNFKSNKFDKEKASLTSGSERKYIYKDAKITDRQESISTERSDQHLRKTEFFIGETSDRQPLKVPGAQYQKQDKILNTVTDKRENIRNVHEQKLKSSTPTQGGLGKDMVTSESQSRYGKRPTELSNLQPYTSGRFVHYKSGGKRNLVENVRTPPAISSPQWSYGSSIGFVSLSSDVTGPRGGDDVDGIARGGTTYRLDDDERVLERKPSISKLLTDIVEIEESDDRSTAKDVDISVRTTNGVITSPSKGPVAERVTRKTRSNKRRSLSLPTGTLAFGDARIVYRNGHFTIETVDSSHGYLPRTCSQQNNDTADMFVSDEMPQGDDVGLSTSDQVLSQSPVSEKVKPVSSMRRQVAKTALLSTMPDNENVFEDRISDLNFPTVGESGLGGSYSAGNLRPGTMVESHSEGVISCQPDADSTSESFDQDSDNEDHLDEFRSHYHSSSSLPDKMESPKKVVLRPRRTASFREAQEKGSVRLSNIMEDGMHEISRRRTGSLYDAKRMEIKEEKASTASDNSQNENQNSNSFFQRMIQKRKSLNDKYFSKQGESAKDFFSKKMPLKAIFRKNKSDSSMSSPGVPVTPLSPMKIVNSDRLPSPLKVHSDKDLPSMEGGGSVPCSPSPNESFQRRHTSADLFHQGYAGGLANSDNVSIQSYEDDRISIRSGSSHIGEQPQKPKTPKPNFTASPRRTSLSSAYYRSVSQSSQSSLQENISPDTPCDMCDSPSYPVKRRTSSSDFTRSNSNPDNQDLPSGAENFGRDSSSSNRTSYDKLSLLVQSSDVTSSNSNDSGIQHDVSVHSSNESVKTSPESEVRLRQRKSPSPRTERPKSDITVRWADLEDNSSPEPSISPVRKRCLNTRDKPRPKSDLEGSSFLSNRMKAFGSEINLQPYCSLRSLYEMRRRDTDPSSKLAKSRRMSTPHPIKSRQEGAPPQQHSQKKKRVSLVRSRSMPESLDKVHKRRKLHHLLDFHLDSLSRHVDLDSLSDDEDFRLESVSLHEHCSSSTRSSASQLTSLDEDEDDNLTFAEALWDHITMDPEELGFRAGAVIDVIDMSDKDWWFGAIEDREGWFPAAFVRIRVNQEQIDDDEADEIDEEELEVSYRENLMNSPKLRRISVINKDQARTNVVNEIISAEQEYVKHLKDVVEGYIRHARKRAEMFSEDRISLIFGNIEDIYTFGSKFLSQLETHLNAEKPHNSEIGQCFLDNVKGFEIYSDYCNNHPSACEELKELYRQTKYKHFFEACRLLQELVEIPLEGFLLTPVQKICKYPLQLAELLKYTPASHPDFQGVEAALVAMRKIARLINERKRKMESIEKIAAWQHTVADWEGEDLLDKSSELLYSGDIHKINSAGWSQERYFFLFDHQLIYCKKELLKRHMFTYKGRIDLDHCEIVDLHDGRDLQYNVTVKNAWKLHETLKDKWYLLYAKTPAGKERWLRALEDEKRRVREDQENEFTVPYHWKQMVLNKVRSHSKDKQPSTRSTQSIPVVYPKDYMKHIPAHATLPRNRSVRHKPVPLKPEKKKSWFTFGGKKTKK